MFRMAKQMIAKDFRVIGIKIFWRAQTPGSLASTAVYVICVLDKYGAGALVRDFISAAGECLQPMHLHLFSQLKLTNPPNPDLLLPALLQAWKEGF
jgi:hypothetical protein